MISSILLIFSMFTPSANAQTVSEDMYLKSRISKSQPLSYETLVEYFGENKQFAYKCVQDSILNKSNNWEDIQTFAKYLNPKSQGSLSIHLEKREFGFDLVFEKSDIPESSPDIYTIKNSLHCDGGGEGQCASLTSESEWEFQFSAVGVEDKSYADSAKRYETWKFYFVEDQIYTTRVVNYEARELGWMGQSKQWYNYSRSEICQLQAHE